MAIDIPSFGSFITTSYNEFLQTLPTWAQNFMNLFLLAFLVAFYAIMIWKFYTWIAKKDILELNLSKYNRFQHRGLAKTLAVLIYSLEYLIILPVIIFVWFSMFTLFLMLLTKNIEIQTLLIASVIMVAAIRITAYYKEELSRDLAKLFPLTLLTVALTEGLINFEKITTQISTIPSFFNEIWMYLLFILVIEYFLRGLDLLFLAFGVLGDEEIVSKY
jgi:hypothetical protein